jgi:glycosyltransferase involved in cell wall biosynthesis
MSTATELTGASVAVIMAVRDGERYVAEALESILEQTEPPGEVVVVDDGSQDGTPAVLARFGDSIRVLRQAPTGQFSAVNRGIAATNAPVLAFLDSDDRFTPTSLEVRLARLGEDDVPDAVFGRIEQFVSPELRPEAAARIRYEAGAVRGELFQAMIIRRSAFERVGPVDSGIRTAGNIDWISRARVAGIRSVEIDDIVAHRRLHNANIGITAAAQKRRDLLSVVRAHRQRSLGPQGGAGP